MAMPILQHSQPMFSPWDISPPASDLVACPEKKPSSSSGDQSSSSPEEGFWDDELLSRKLAEKLLESRQENDVRNLLDKYPGGIPLDNMQQQHDANKFYYGNWGEDYVNQTYRSVNPRFKTEICRNFKEKGTCLYGDLCQFAHGNHELRKDVVRHSKYKTKLCQKYWIAGYCAYGPRCNFIHQEIERDQALRILAGISMEARSGGSMYKATNNYSKGHGVVGRKGSALDAIGGDSDFERNFSQLGLGGRYDERYTPLSRSPVDYDMSIADLLPSNFGLVEDGYKEEGDIFSRRAIGSERKLSVWSEVWGSQ